MDWMLMPLKRYAEFSGRSQRMEYWMFVLFQVIVIVALMLLTGIMGAIFGSEDGELGVVGGLMAIIMFVFIFGLIVPTIAVTVRRLHDQDKSGWWYLLNFVPFGGIVLFVFMCLDGTPGPNQYGPDPKGDAGTFE